MIRSLLVCVVAALATSASAQLCPPETLAVLPRGELLGGHVSIDIDGDRLAVYSPSLATTAADGSYNVELFDVSDPTAPTLISTIQAQAFSREEVVRLRGDTLWMFDGGFAWTIPLTGEPVIAPPPSDGFWNTYVSLPGTPTGGFENIDYQFNDAGLLYVTNRGWLRTYDSTSPTEFFELPLVGAVRYSPVDQLPPTLIEGDVLYAVAIPSPPPGEPFSSEILIWDIADPAAAELVSETTFDGYDLFAGIQLDGERLYLSGLTPQGTSGRAIVDITDKHAPNLLGVVDPGGVFGFATGNLVIEMDSTQCLLGWSVYDITDPSAPRYRSAVDFEGPVVRRGLETLTPEFVLLREVSLGGGPRTYALRFVRPPECFQDPDYNVLVTDEDIVIEASDTEILGIPLSEARIYVGRVGLGSTLPPGCAGTRGRLTLRGDHRIDFLDATPGSEITIEGILQASSVRADDATLSIDGTLETGSLELFNGSVITQEQP